MADIYSFNVETGEVYIRALPSEDLSGWVLVSYGQSGGGSAPTDGQLVDTSMPYVSEPDDGYYYYLQDLGPLSSPSEQRDALVLTDDTLSVVDAVGWGKDEDFDLIGGPGDGIIISPGDGNYAPGDGPWYTDGPPWDTSPPPTDLEPLPPPCFAAGTLIDTPFGPSAIESLKKGQLVSTLEGYKPIRWVGGSKVRLDGTNTRHLRPVRFSANSLGIGQPVIDVLLSQQHRVYCASALNELMFGVAGVLASAKHLVNGESITVEAGLDEVEYYHLLLDTHSIVRTSGINTETLLLSEWVASQSSFRALAEFHEIFPDGLTEAPELSSKAAYPVLKRHEAELLQWQ